MFMCTCSCGKCYRPAIDHAYPVVVIESDTAQVSGLQLVESDTSQVSVLPVASRKFPAVFCGLGGDFADYDRRTSPVDLCSPGRNPGG